MKWIKFSDERPPKKLAVLTYDEKEKGSDRQYIVLAWDTTDRSSEWYIIDGTNCCSCPTAINEPTHWAEIAGPE